MRGTRDPPSPSACCLCMRGRPCSCPAEGGRVLRCAQAVGCQRGDHNELLPVPYVTEIRCINSFDRPSRTILEQEGSLVLPEPGRQSLNQRCCIAMPRRATPTESGGRQRYFTSLRQKGLMYGGEEDAPCGTGFTPVVLEEASGCLQCRVGPAAPAARRAPARGRGRGRGHDHAVTARAHHQNSHLHRPRQVLLRLGTRARTRRRHDDCAACWLRHEGSGPRQNWATGRCWTSSGGAAPAWNRPSPTRRPQRAWLQRRRAPAMLGPASWAWCGCSRRRGRRRTAWWPSTHWAPTRRTPRRCPAGTP